MQKYVLWVFVFVFCLGLLIGHVPATAKETSVAVDILNILYESGQIDKEQYDALLKKARQEKEEQSEEVLDKAMERMDEERAAEADQSDYTVYWKNGLQFESRDEAFKLKLGGRLLNDWAYIDGDSDTESLARLDEDADFGSGTEMRQGRLFLSGSLYEDLRFKVQYDFAGSDADFKDTWIGFANVPYVGNVKVGHFKEPFSLENLTSRKYIRFMERGLQNAFVPGRNTGVMVNDSAMDGQMTWGAGFFRDVDNAGFGFGEDETYNFTARVTGLPYYADQGRQLLHLGLSYSHKWIDNDSVSFSSRPQAHLTSAFVDTGDIAADGVDLVSPEAAFVSGPFSVQGEYVSSLVDDEAGNDPHFMGYYLQGSYFLTGEHRPYSRSSGAFSRIKPKQNFALGGEGWGAFEVALRYSALDLEDEQVNGGELDTITAGLNWYLYPNLRMMLNYIYADLDDVGETNIIQSRFQIDF